MANSAVKKKKESEQTVRRRTIRKVTRLEAARDDMPRSYRREFVALLLAVFGVFLTLALISAYQGQVLISSLGSTNTMGLVGASTANILIRNLGWCSFVAVVWAFLLARTIWYASSPARGGFSSFVSVVFGFGLMAASGASLAAIYFGSEGGGSFGVGVSSRLMPYLNVGGATLVSGFVFLVSLIVATGVSATEIFGWFGKLGHQSRVVGSTLARIQFHATVFLARHGYRGLAIFVGRVIGKLQSPPKKSEERSVSPGFLRRLVSRGKISVQADAATGSAQSDSIDCSTADEEEELETADFNDDDLEDDRYQADMDGEEDDDDFDEDDEEDLYDTVDESYEPNILLPNEQRAKHLAANEKRKASTKPAALKPQETRDVPDFQLPPIDLLAKPEQNSQLVPKREDILRNCKQLERTLLDFRIGGRVVDAAPGPVITLYQFEPAPGVKVQRIINLADDLALALKVASVRVYAPVPGKGTVGIEVPNEHREIVRLSDILDSERFLEVDSPLTLALGKDIAGEAYVADLAKMPHLLIAGATGTGKSVCINSLLLSLLYRNAPKDMRLILIDPKMLELSSYEGIPHLKAPVVTLAKRARGVLWWAVEEMERRYKLMMDLGVKNLDGYNKAVGSPERSKLRLRRRNEPAVIELEEKDIVAVTDPHVGIKREEPVESLEFERIEVELGEPLPRIVIVIDELADLMLTVGREVEELVTRLAQKARASGIHLVLATQRPSVDVITGLIKANFPARISFKVASRIDARTVLDSSGAENLLGQGDMLFMTAGAGRPRRIHSAFVSDSEVNDVCDWLREQGDPDYDPQIEEMARRMDELEQSNGSGVQEEFDFDPLYDQAVNLVAEKGQASTSMVQRAFRIGYNRAARILETMEREGVVGPADGARPRQVLLGGRDHT